MGTGIVGRVERRGRLACFHRESFFLFVLLLFLTSLFFRGKRECVECMGLKRKCGMTEKESQKSSTRRTTKRKRADEDDGDDDDDEERPRSMRLGEIVDRLETYTERAEALDKKLEERRVTDREWQRKMMNRIDASNSYAEALKHNTNFLYQEVRGMRGLIDELMMMVEGLVAKKKKTKRWMASVGVETEVTEEKVPEATEENGDGSSTDGEKTEGEVTDGETDDGGRSLFASLGKNIMYLENVCK